ncbi:hypothetical protein ACS0TY_006411 [Phlomoides rotata]
MLMIHTYALEKYPWFERLYKIKTKWCTTLNNDFFSAGLLSSQRSESTNHSLGFNTNKSTTLSKFYEIFVVKVADWRKKEKNDEFQCSRKIPHPALPLAGLLEHAVKVYTLRLFSDFETEFMKCISACSTITVGIFSFDDCVKTIWIVMLSLSKGSEISIRYVRYQIVRFLKGGQRLQNLNYGIDLLQMKLG